MQLFQMKNRIFPGRKIQQTQNKVIRSVQSPALIHHHLRLDYDLLQPEAIQQIKACVDESVTTSQPVQNLVVAIDITCQSDLISEGIAEQLAHSILSALDQHYPGLRDRFIGISDDEACLPLRDLMLTGKLALEEIDNQHLFVFE